MQKVELRIKGLIDRDWSNWLTKPSVTHTAGGETLLTGVAEDQSALYGLLSRLSGLGVQVMSLTCDAIDPSTVREVKEMRN